MITTTYHDNGIVTVVEESLGTWCDGDCTGGYPSTCDDTGDNSDPENGGGGGGSDNIVSGEDDLSITRSEPAPNPNTGEINGPVIPIVFHAWVGWSYNFAQQRFDFITTGPPYPVPVSQVYTDANGNPAVLAASVLPGWIVRQIPVTIKAMRIHYTFVSARTYTWTTGPPKTFTFDEILSKIIGPL